MERTIKDLCSIVAGQILSRVEASDKDEVVRKDVKTIVAKTIEEGFINDEYMVKNYKSELSEERITKEGDIVIKLSYPYSAAIVDKEHEGMFISQFCVIARANSKNMNYYIAAYINSEKGREKLKASLGQSNQLLLTSRNVSELVIPKLPNEEELNEWYKKILNTRVMMNKALKLEQEKLLAVFSEVK